MCTVIYSITYAMDKYSGALGASSWAGLNTWNPRNMKVRTSPALSLLFLLKHTTTWEHLRCSSAYSRSEINPSFDPSGSVPLGTVMNSLPSCKIVSQHTSMFSETHRRNTRTTGASSESSKMFFSSFSLIIKSCITG